ncbi:MAG: glycerol-3-phosphate O-acyltransferase/dihydroxyacetone phosphate acyltransferase, partial [Hyphomicrobiaceae bacterium]
MPHETTLHNNPAHNPYGNMYWLISTITCFALDLFFKRVHVEGAVPKMGPVILVANHFNALLDPVMVTRLVGRNVRFLGKEPLFHTPVLKHLVKGMGTLPVYRAMDGADTSKNKDMFAAVYAALGEGNAVCLFPEGVSHNEPQLQSLKTGAARMALGAEAEHGFSLGLKVVPVGLVFSDKRRFRSVAATFVGQPINISEYQEAYRQDDRDAARAL